MKTAILITARLKSTRLPRKVLRPLHGKPMLGQLLGRLRLAKRPEQIVIITSPLDDDRPLVELAKQEGVGAYCGDPDDVLRRMRDASREFGVDTVVSCTADNPFVDPVYIDRLVDFHLEQGHDFTNSEGLPFGVFAYALQREAIERACEIKDEIDTEVWGGYFTQTGQFRWGTLKVTDPAVRWPELRLTVDTPEDFTVVEKIFEELGEGERIFPLEEIVDLCRRRPEIVAINAAVEQKPGIPIRVKAGMGDQA